MFSKWFSSKTIDVHAPVAGMLIKLEQVPDPVFAQKITGDGVAIEPTEGKVFAPFDGKIIHLFATNHAIILEHANGIQLLIHIGLDTVKLNGEGFTSHVQIGEKVKVGDLLIEFNIDKIKSAGYSPISPLVILNGDIVEQQEIKKLGTILKGEEILSIKLK